MRVELADGRVLEFPDGTDPEIIKRTVKGLVGDFASRAAGLSEDELSMARAKNDEFGAYLREQAKQPKPGETEAETFKRLYGSLTTEERPSIPEGMARSALQGATFGFGDELVGAGTAALDAAIRGEEFGPAYEQRRNRERARMDQFSQDYPVTSTATEIAGAVPTAMAPFMNAPRAMQAANPIVRGALVGGGQGAAYGFGSGRGDAGDQALSAAQGAAFGTAGGTLGALASKGIQNAVGRYMASKGAKKVGMSYPEWQMINRAMSIDDSLTGQGARRMSRGGSSAMLADAGQGNATLLDQAITKSPAAANIARQNVGGRAAQQRGILENAMNKALGKPGASSSRELMVYGDRTNPISLIYKKAYSQPIDYSSKAGMQLENLIKNNVPPDAINAANKLLRMEGHQSQQIMAHLDDAGNVVFERMPDVRQIDYITRGLNQAAESGEGAGALGGQTTLGRAYQNLSRQIRNELKTAVPDYEKALNVASEAIGKKQARELGVKALSRSITRADMADELRGMSKSELAKVAEGVRLKIDDDLAEVRRTLANPNADAREAAQIITKLNTRANREKVSMVIGKKAADELFDQIDQSSVAFELQARVATGSQTAGRLSAQQAADDIIEGGAVNAFREGEVIGTPKAIWKSVMGRSPEAKQAMSDKLYTDIVNSLTGPQGPQARRILEQIMSTQPGIREGTKRAGEATQNIFNRSTAVTAPTMDEYRRSNSYLLPTGQ